MKCGRLKCKVCKMELDNDIEDLYANGLGYRSISKKLAWKVSHMSVKRHLDAIKNKEVKVKTS